MTAFFWFRSFLLTTGFTSLLMTASQAQTPSLNPQQIQALIAGGRASAAIVALEPVIVSNPKSGVAWYLLAEAQDATGNIDAARNALAIAEQMAPGLPFADPDKVAALQAHLSGGSTSMSSGIVPSGRQWVSAPTQLGTFDHWTLVREINPGDQNPKQKPFCAIIDRSVLSDAIDNKDGIALQGDKYHHLNFLFDIQSNTPPTSSIEGTIAYSNGTISNINLNHVGQIFDDLILDRDDGIALFMNLAKSETLTITIPGIPSGSFYLGDSGTALESLLSCIQGLPN